MTDHFYFFSYGSNLLLERIRKRTPSVEVLQEYRLDQFRLVFNKLSQKDGSTKANLARSDQSYVYGVIHRIDIAEKPELDKAEGRGRGYNLDYFELSINNQSFQIGYYIAKESKYLFDGKPFDWYLEYVKYGAIENGFPPEYQRQLDEIEFDVDQNEDSRKEHDLLLANYR